MIALTTELILNLSYFICNSTSLLCLKNKTTVFNTAALPDSEQIM